MISTTRAQALAQGLKTYVVAPCKRGHSGVRRASDGSCVVCRRETNRTDSARAQAVAQGLKIYLGAPCKRGHDGKRYTSSWNCVMCMQELDRKRSTTDPEKYREQALARYHANRETILPRRRARYDANIDKTHEQARKYTAAHIEEICARSAAWKKDHPGAVRATNAKRRALKKSQRCNCCTDTQIAEKYKQASLCGRGAEVDHIVQLALGGSHCCRNLMALTFEEHKIKSKQDAKERAEVRRRNKLLRSWRDPVPTLQKAQTVVPIAPLGPQQAVLAAAA